MASSRLWNWLRGSRGNGSAVSGVTSIERFRDVIARERAIADRGSYDFSIVVFEPGDALAQDAYADGLSTGLATRVRSTDTIGWFSEGVIGVLLPHTSADGAWKLAEDVQKILQPTLPTTVLVYTYPNGSARSAPLFPSDSEHHAKKRPGPDAERRNGGSGSGDDAATVAPAPTHKKEKRNNGTGNPSSAPSEPSISGDRHGKNDPAADTLHRSERNGTESLEAFLTHPMPVWKRTLDIVGASCALLVLLPLMVVIAIAIRCTSRGPALFLQDRAGQGNRPFKMVKFRTMVLGAEDIQFRLRERNERTGPAFKMKRDPRVTRVGRILRRFSLDELPQFYNVLVGEMSLVGPRPLPCEESEVCTGWLRRRLELTPGVTGLWQVSGRSEKDFDEWVRLDLRYARSQSLLLDLKLLVLTIPAVVVGRGAH